jgi:signal peptidase II
MLANRTVRTLVIVLILVSNIGCDQISKSLVRSSLLRDEQILMFDNHVMLTRVENSGAFLSLGDSLSDEIRFLVLVLIPIIILSMAIMYLFLRNDMSRSFFIGMGFVIGGGIGNIYDRYLYGSVTDFLHLNFTIFRTGVFNLADVSIMTGLFIVLIAYMIKKTTPLDNPTDPV